MGPAGGSGYNTKQRDTSQAMRMQLSAFFADARGRFCLYSSPFSILRRVAADARII
jgi:hypothetical protein